MSKLNIKGKIVIGVGSTIIVGGLTYLIISSIRKRNIRDRIYSSLNNTSGEGFQNILDEKNQILGSLAFDPNFWKGEGSIKPDPSFFANFTTSDARQVARNIKDSMGRFVDNESAIVSEIRKLKSKGQVSLVSYVYQNHPLSFGNLSNDIVNATTGWFDSPIYIQQINNHINNLPN